jgi:hypothetical protein
MISGKNKTSEDRECDVSRRDGTRFQIWEQGRYILEKGLCDNYQQTIKKCNDF